jgi:hypothetical protein
MDADASALDRRPTASRSTARPLVLIAVAVGLVVVGAVVAVVALGSRTATYPPDSPEAALQGYLTAFQQDDREAAYSFFSTRVRAAMSPTQYGQEIAMRGGEPDARIWIDRSDVKGDRATLHLTVERYYGAGLQSSRYRSQAQVRMVREDGTWRIDDQLIGVEPGMYYPAPAAP